MKKEKESLSSPWWLESYVFGNGKLRAPLRNGITGDNGWLFIHGNGGDVKAIAGAWVRATWKHESGHITTARQNPWGIIAC